MRRNSALLALPLLLLAATSLAAADAVERFGEPLGEAPTVALATLLQNPEAYAGKRVLTSGKVRAACSKKGCWMELSPSADKKAPGCRVTFKNYGFFVPLDSAGSDARVDGVVSLKTIAKAEVEHMEQEGGSFAKKLPDGSALEVRLVATGVELRGRKR